MSKPVGREYFQGLDVIYRQDELSHKPIRTCKNPPVTIQAGRKKDEQMEASNGYTREAQVSQSPGQSYRFERADGAGKK